MKLSENKYPSLKEGADIYKIIKVDEKDGYGKVSVTFQNSQGTIRTENYITEKANGEENPVAITILSNLCRNAMKDWDLSGEFKVKQIVGKFVAGICRFSEYQDKIYPNLGYFKSANNFGDIIEMNENGFISKVYTPDTSDIKATTKSTKPTKTKIVEEYEEDDTDPLDDLLSQL